MSQTFTAGTNLSEAIAILSIGESDTLPVNRMIAQSQSHSVSTDEGNESERQIGSPVRGRGRSSSKVTTPSKSQKKAFPLSKSPKKVKTRENPSSQEIEASSMSVSRKRSSSKKHSSCPTETPLAKRTRSSGAAPSAACATENSMVIADKGDCRVYGPYDFFEDVDALWDIVQGTSRFLFGITAR